MSPSPVDTMPPGTVASIFDSLLASRWPRQDKPAIASRYGITIADLQTLLRRHNAEDLDPRRLAAAAAALRAQDAEQPPQTTDAAQEQPSSTPAGQKPTQRLVRVRVDELRADPNNLREHIARKSPDAGDRGTEGLTDIDQLAESIQQAGLLQPIVVRETYQGDRLVYTIVAGHRRHAALVKLRHTTTEVLVRPPMAADDVLAAMLIENGQRAGLDPIEEARGIRKLGTTHGWTDEQTAAKIGRSKSYVSMRLALLALSADDQERIRAGEMGVTAGANLGRLNSGKTYASKKGHRTVDYFGPTNELARLARARCNRLEHPGKKIAGGEACGACWESVIRADERNELQKRNATADNCVTCGEPIDPDRPTP